MSGRRLWLFVCCHGLDAPSFKMDLLVGIVGCPTSSSSSLATGPTPYLWTHRQRCEFLPPGDDFFAFPFPLLSDLVADPGVREHDAFTICISITESYGLDDDRAITFQPPGQVNVPVDLVAALGALVDLPAGADVRFVCLEHQTRGDEDGEAERISSRKRIVYANSQVLGSRSTYFADLFKGDFAESSSVVDERYKTVIVESADFETVYWMLRYVHAPHTPA